LVNLYGADVLRLWVASQDYQEDVTFTNEVVDRVADTYRSIRNTLRILLGNLADFDPEKDSVPAEKWNNVDGYFHDEFAACTKEILAGYHSYNFASVYQEINRFCTAYLSAVYVDVLKDRLYCCAAKSIERRAAQTVMHIVLEYLIKAVAPIMPYTAEETWKALGKSNSVHLEIIEELTPARLEVFRKVEKWLKFRDELNYALEEKRTGKIIGKSLEAHVEIKTCYGKFFGESDKPSDLEELFIVSKVVIKPTEGEETITVTRAEDHGMKKCVRCWKYWDHIGSHAEHPELCDRCTNVVLDLKF